MDATKTSVHAVFHDSKDMYVSVYVLYANASKLYIDAEHTTEVTHDEAFDACFRGVLVYDETNGYVGVTSFKDADGTLTINAGETAYTVSEDPLE